MICSYAIFATMAVVALANPLLDRLPALPTGRVVGGVNAGRNAAPFIVSLKDADGTHFCGGSIINNRTIVTAAHCLRLYPCDDLTIVAGQYQLDDSNNTQVRSPKRCVVHEWYGDYGVAPFDIGLIHLNQTLNLTEANVSAVRLPPKDRIPSGNATLYGWGSTSTTNIPSIPNTLQTVTKPILDYNVCETLLGGPGASQLDPTSNVCTGPLSGGISACNRDSGGPLVQPGRNGSSVLVGIVSWGFTPCGGPNQPSIYTRTSAFISWIKTH